MESRKCSSCGSLLSITTTATICNMCLASQINNVRLAAQDFESFLVNCVRRIDMADLQVRQVEKACNNSIASINVNANRLQMGTRRIFDAMRAVLVRYEQDLLRQISEERRRKIQFLDRKRDHVIDRRRLLAQAKAKCENAQRQFDMNKLEMLAKREEIERELRRRVEVPPDVAPMRVTPAAVRLNAHNLIKDLMNALPRSSSSSSRAADHSGGTGGSVGGTGGSVGGGGDGGGGSGTTTTSQESAQRPKRRSSCSVASATGPPPKVLLAPSVDNENRAVATAAVAAAATVSLPEPESSHSSSQTLPPASDETDSWPLNFEIEHGKMVFPDAGSGSEGTASPPPPPPEEGVRVKTEDSDDARAEQNQDGGGNEDDNESQSNDRNYDWCAICYDGGNLICCDNCSLAYHFKCANLKKEPEGVWLCSVCRGRLLIPEHETVPDDVEPGQECTLLLDVLRWHENSWPFREPVSPKQAPNYFEIISRPISLRDIKKELMKGTYKDNQRKFVEDVELIFSNCSQYNLPFSEVAALGRSLQSFFKQMLAKYAPHLLHREEPAPPATRIKQEKF
ncbi:E3 ubiquitin-protein ligase TRIM33-like [Oscarella lobularis]|uniref:E3 ubiquitin-protein ligase TRIM33-like n=1 Tax=Oscarella lobularis TaxID=121494 RepID=UPI003313D202